MSTPESPYQLPEQPLPVRLVNTVWAQRGVLRDDLATTGQALTWLRANGLPTDSVDSAELDAVVELRTALRTVATHLIGEAQPGGPGADPVNPVADVEAALTVINARFSGAPAGRLALIDGRVQWSAASPGSRVEDALATIAAAAITTFTGTDAALLRACHGPRCVLFFVQDHPRRQWCSLACGNRARAARHYQRHHDDTAP